MAASGGFQAGLGLTFVGILLAVFAGTLWSVCASAQTGTGVAPSCSTFEALVVLGVLLLVIGLAVVASSAWGRTRTIYPTTDPAVPPPLIRPVVVQQTVVQQTVEVRCRYCGALNPVTGTKCTSCGAAL